MATPTVEPFVDSYGNHEPRFAPGSVYLGNLGRGRVCRVVGRPGKVKVVGQSPGCTAVTRSRPGRSLTTKDGQNVVSTSPSPNQEENHVGD